MDGNGNIAWYDDDCYNKYRFVCELDDPCPLKKHHAHESNDSSGGSYTVSVSQETYENGHSWSKGSHSSSESYSHSWSH
jgi:hypothetical protein